MSKPITKIRKITHALHTMDAFNKNICWRFDFNVVITFISILLLPIDILHVVDAFGAKC